MLRRLLEAGARPSAIVVDYKPSILAGGPKFSLRHWQTVATPREAFELALASKSPALLSEITLGRLLPSVRDRVEIREAILALIRGEVASNHATNRLALRNWGANRGAHVNSARTDGELTAEIHKRMLSDHWKWHRINAIYIERLLDLADSRQIPMYWLIPPLPPGLQAKREQTGVDAAFVDFIRKTQARHPGLVVIDGRRSGYESLTFADHTHLNGRGAVTLSHDLGEILATPPGSSRWIALPRFRDGTSSLTLEDVDQSRMAIDAASIRR